MTRLTRVLVCSIALAGCESADPVTPVSPKPRDPAFSLNTSSVDGSDLVIKITGTYTKEFFYPESFGSTAATLPVSLTAVVDDALLQHFPAGSVFHSSSGRTFVNDAAIAPLSAVKALSASLGSHSWTEDDVIAHPTFSYAFIIEGGIIASSQLVAVQLSSSTGLLSLMELSCSGLACSLLNFGSAADNITGSDGIISDILVEINTPVELIEQLRADVQDLGLKTAALDAAIARLAGKNAKSASAISSLESFIKFIDGQRGKKLTDAQANDFIARANEIISYLSS